MSLTLDATLQAAQDGQVHNPIIELKASQWTDDIPFDGQFLLKSTENERNPNVMVHSAGNLCAVYSYQSGGNWYIRYVYTDADRTIFNFVNFTSYYSIEDISICELANGNVGIIYRYNFGSWLYIRYKVITVTGTLVADNTIFDIATTSYLSGPSVIKLSDDTYLMAYTKKVGSDYKFYQRTSSNFTSWSAETEIVIGGLTSTKRKSNPSLIQISNDDIFLWFDYLESTGASGEELTNIYYSIYSGSWGNAVKVTNYTNYGAKAVHPLSVQKVINTLHMAFTDDRSALHMDSTAPGWCTNSGHLKSLQFDAVNRKLYLVIRGASAAGLSCVIKIDVDTWAVDDYWNCTTTPGFSSPWCAGGFEIYTGSLYCNTPRGDGPIVPFFNTSAAVAVLDAEADTIKEYYFHDVPAWSKTRNVEWTPHDLSKINVYYVQSIQADYANRKLWVYLTWSSGGDYAMTYGWIDLDETIDPGGKYTFHDQISFYNSAIFPWFALDALFLPGENLVMFSYYKHGWAPSGRFTILILSTGAEWKHWDWNDDPNFHYLGFINFRYIPSRGKVYGNFTYTTDNGQGDRRGLMEVDINTNAVQYHRPTYATLDDYKLTTQFIDGSNNIWIGSDTYGVIKFNTTDLTWTLYNNANLPGLTPSASDKFRYVVYDDYKEMVYSTTASTNPWIGIVAFLEAGRIQRSYYTIGEYTTSWTFPEPDPLVMGLLDYDASLAFDPSDGGMYAFWVNKLAGEEFIKWDKEVGDFYLSGFIVKGVEHSIHWTIDGNPAEANFTISKGHLFDPHNNYSLWSIYLKKGKKLTLRLGEKISDVDYWQNQGVFTIDETSLIYEKGKYPDMQIIAKDRFAVWENHDVIATDYYAILPKPAIEDIVTNHTNFTLSDIDLPVFDGGIELYKQWLDTNVYEIIKQICNRFGYYPRMDINGKLTAKKIDENGSIDHIYSDTTKIINFSPDDTFSDYTNRLTVVGEERSFIEVIFAEERVATLNGTVGWYGFKKDYEIYYSEDKSRRCMSPRLEVLEAASSIAFELEGKITQEISYIDPNDKYCVVTVTAPDLRPHLLGAIAAIIGAYFIGDDFIVPNVPYAGKTLNVGSLLRSIAIVLALMILGAVGNFQFVIWARPVGKIRRSIQGQANDLQFQIECGMVVEKKIEGDMCYTVTQCIDVAEWELMIARLQRNRGKFSKISHLQDEAGDIIQISHPYTGASVKFLIPDLTRKIKIPEEPDGDGYIIDAMECWVLK